MSEKYFLYELTAAVEDCSGSALSVTSGVLLSQADS